MTDKKQSIDTEFDPIGAEFDLAIALGWRPWYDRPGAFSPAGWTRPDGTRVVDVPDWGELLAEVRRLRAAELARPS